MKSQDIVGKRIARVAQTPFPGTGEGQSAIKYIEFDDGSRLGFYVLVCDSGYETCGMYVDAKNIPSQAELTVWNAIKKTHV